MSSFLLPCGALIVVFWVSFGLFYYMIKSQIEPVLKSVKRIERSLGTRTTEEFPNQQPQLRPRPRPVAPSRYVTVERQMR